MPNLNFFGPSGAKGTIMSKMYGNSVPAVDLSKPSKIAYNLVVEPESGFKGEIRMTDRTSDISRATECVARVKSVEEYLNLIDQAFGTICNPAQGSNCELWYRGAVQQQFPLLPRIARNSLNPLFEIVFLSKFKSLVIPYVERLPAFPLPGGLPPYWSWLFMMQHYGVPTRMLDWSLDALTALYFATNPEDTSRVQGIDAVVWVLNPVMLNEAFSFHSFLKPGYIPNVEEPSFNLFFGPNSQILSTKKPAAAIGPMNTTRIVAQRGVFTVFPHIKNLVALEDFADSSRFLFKICVAWESFDLIHTQLQHYGITKLTLFPDIDVISNEIFLQVMEESVETIDP